MYWAKSKEDIIKDWDYFKTITFLKHFDKNILKTKTHLVVPLVEIICMRKKVERYMENFDKRLKSEIH